MRPPADNDSAVKLAYLRDPRAYPDAPVSIETIETHFAWVFLSREFVYKLKKPIRLPYLDLSSALSRRANCELEIALNRRLAADTYISVVALGKPAGGLRLESNQNPVDWLVKMRRLPREHTLEHLLPGIDADDPRLGALIDKLAGFYRASPRAPWNAEAYAESLCRLARESADRVMLPELESEHARVNAIAEMQLEFVARHASLLARRIADGRVCDVHGDLRPEHIFLMREPQIIDCLEFSAELRQLDTAEEISFLTLECEMRGRSDIGRRLYRLYCEACDDEVPRHLFAFYRSRRAIVRAFLSAWHIAECRDENSVRHWRAQAGWYIAAAESGIREA